MKSIYEASVAYGREHQGTVNIEDFEAGANYVLEEITDVINRPIKDYMLLGKDYLKLEKLKKVIEQLKK